MNFREELKSKTAAVEKIVESYLPEESGTQHEIMEAMNYSVTAGGKRLRPLLMQETYRMFGGEGREVEPFMAAMEMIHTYSLVHDDMPAMDNDEYRRGKLTTHAKFGHAMGVLAGDALLNYAFETAAEAFDKSTDLRRTAKALQILRAQRTLGVKVGIRRQFFRAVHGEGKLQRLFVAFQLSQAVLPKGRDEGFGRQGPAAFFGADQLHRPKGSKAGQNGRACVRQRARALQAGRLVQGADQRFGEDLLHCQAGFILGGEGLRHALQLVRPPRRQPQHGRGGKGAFPGSFLLPFRQREAHRLHGAQAPAVLAQGLHIQHLLEGHRRPGALQGGVSFGPPRAGKVQLPFHDGFAP